MKLQKVLNELQAEIENGKIPGRGLFSDTGHKIDISDVRDKSEWGAVIKEIVNAIKEAGLENDFKKYDIDSVDIQGKKPNGKISVVSDTGKKYVYDVNKKKLFKV